MKMQFLLVAGVVASLGIFAPVAAADASKDKPVVDKKAPDYVRCRRFAEIGSLVAQKKICRTNAEWEKQGDLENAAARRFVQQNAGAIPGN